jgi:SOS response associated peptidase (SRAP)
MCGRVIQSSGPLCYGIVAGMDMRDSRVHNYPPRWNAAPSQDLLLIRRNHDTGIVSLDALRWGLIPHWCQDPNDGRKPINAKCETVDRLPMFREASLADIGHVRAMSALPRKADISRTSRNVRYVPIGDIGTCLAPPNRGGLSSAPCLWHSRASGGAQFIRRSRRSP